MRRRDEAGTAAKAVEARGLVKVYEGRRDRQVRALDGIDVSSNQGEYLVLLGPSGCGKTTLLRTIAGLERPTEGEVYIGGQLVNGLPPRIRRVAMVLQSYALYPHKTVHSNIEFPLKAENVPRHLRERKIRWAADLLGIPDLLGRRPRQLSGGERQRVALARALVREPAVFLLDEPLSGLDAKLRATTRDELKRFQRQIGTATIYVTHDQEEAMGLGDRVAVLDAGRLRQVGTPRDIYDEPADTFVATFVGSPPMNLVQRANRLVGFRPEHLLPAENVAYDSRVTMPLRIERIEYLSGDRHVYGTVTKIGTETRVIARLPATVITPLAPGETHEFAVPGDRLRFFDAEYGIRTAPVRIGG
ncbi:ABC transporter ATP-binding protein [Actinoallomurus iriomotensis]|uniref:ABC transporter ATP-binding protein n=1 Tax=Actinoallomurus iriomotensis TaxID=478107 RepID=A0A9W6RID5_9ACTN|nr:ABC transporter ATP-binding protein [Actinoallomurus iriomotensis]GLY74440.1 ABC transporter ATP-binding protein [Actinoallomurus iriomotensis]